MFFLKGSNNLFNAVRLRSVWMLARARKHKNINLVVKYLLLKKLSFSTISTGLTYCNKSLLKKLDFLDLICVLHVGTMKI